MSVIAAVLVALHLLDGRQVDINPAQVTSMQAARDHAAEHKAFVRGVRCMINLADGKFVAVVEDCDKVRQLLKQRE